MGVCESSEHENEQRYVAGNSQHVSSYRGANIIHTECQTNNTITLPFCSKNFGSISITSWGHGHVRKYTRLSLQACIISMLTFRCVGAWEPENEATFLVLQLKLPTCTTTVMLSIFSVSTSTAKSAFPSTPPTC